MENNIKMVCRKLGCEGRNWIQLAQERVQWQAFVNVGMKLYVQ
jgi:hypothetical protein